MSIKATDLTNEDIKLSLGDEIMLQRANDGLWIKAEYVSENSIGVGVLVDGYRFRYYPYTALISIEKAVNR